MILAITEFYQRGGQEGKATFALVSLFHVEHSIDAKGAAMRAPATTNNDRALDTGERGQGEMTYPENEIRPLVCRDALAYPFDHPFFEMKTGYFVREKVNAHLLV